MTQHDADTLHAQRLERARLSLRGLSVGDAFGECFFVQDAMTPIAARRLPAAMWRFTDDTVMAISIVETLEAHRGVEPDDLAARFARRYQQDPGRDYGRGVHEILNAVLQGKEWREAAAGGFGGQGSMGNGGAMRAAPVGAYFADDVDAAVLNAGLSSRVTHTHPEGVAGTVAVAVAAAVAAQPDERSWTARGRRLLETARDRTPDGDTRYGLTLALDLPDDATIEEAAMTLGTGQRVLSQDTVPFSLWCAARHLDDFTEAMWTTVAGLGDRDTTCAIVGGIVGAAHGSGGVPAAWDAATERLPGPDQRLGLAP